MEGPSANGITIRLAHSPAEDRAIEEVIRDSFWNHFQPGADEHFLLHTLRQRGEDFLPELHLVAEADDGKLVGAIVYSRSRVVQADGQSTTPTMTFGPVGVLPEYRHRGIARMLIEKSLHLAKGLGCSACLIYGDPRIYGRLGFRCAEKWDVTNAQGDFVVCLMARELQSGAMQAMQGGRFEESAVFGGVDPDALAVFDASFPPRDKDTSAFQEEFRTLLSLSYPRCAGDVGTLPM